MMREEVSFLFGEPDCVPARRLVCRVCVCDETFARIAGTVTHRIVSRQAQTFLAA
jgi:hypothetical protein